MRRPEAHPATSQGGRGRDLLRNALIAGAGASLLSSAVLSLAGKWETGRAAAPTNATSHWLWGRAAYGVHEITWRHTMTGYLIHHTMATFWALLHFWAHGPRMATQRWPAVVAVSGATAALACLIDYTITPRRLRPGFERTLSRRAVAAAYGGFALGLALGCRLAIQGGKA